MDPLTSTLNPLESSTITVRVIKSFPHRNIKSIVLHNIDLTTVHPSGLLTVCKGALQKWKAYKDTEVDTFKIYTHAHASKTVSLTINLDHDEDWILNKHVPLMEYGIRNESELSLFSFEKYTEWKSNPLENWE